MPKRSEDKKMRQVNRAYRFSGRLDKAAGEQLVRRRPTGTKMVKLPQPHEGEPCIESLVTTTRRHCLFCWLDT